MADALLLDIEVYKNYFLVGFRNSVTGNTRQFEMFEGHHGGPPQSLLT